MTSAAGCGKTDGRHDPEGRRRAFAAREKDLCGAAGTCRLRLMPEFEEMCWQVRANGECSGNRAFRLLTGLHRLTAGALRLTQGYMVERSSGFGIAALRTPSLIL